MYGSPTLAIGRGGGWPQIIRHHTRRYVLQVQYSLYTESCCLGLVGNSTDTSAVISQEKMSTPYFFRWASKLSQAPPPSGRRQSNSPTQLSSSAPSGGTVSCRWVAAPVVPVPLFQPGRTATVVPVPLVQAGGNRAGLHGLQKPSQYHS
jgi:hypothetical protein